MAMYHLLTNHKDPQELDLTNPRLASYEKKWKRHQDTVYLFDIQLAQRDRTQSSSTIHFQFFVSRK